MELAMQAFKEIWTSLFAWRIWLTVGIEDVIGRYRRTTLGPLWIVLSQSAYIFGLYLVRGAISGSQTSQYLLYLAISIPAWNLLASSLTDGSNALMRSKGYIDSYPLPLPIYIIRTVVAGLVNFFHVLVVFFAIILISRTPHSLNYLMFFPGLVLIIIFCFGACLGLSCIGARFRDLNPAITSFVAFMFVFCPIFWIPTEAQKASLVVRLDPFYYLLELLREPLMYPHITPSVWGIGCLISLSSLVFGAIVYKIMRPSVVYWL
jgi:ABC-type polysaccharide/polyol phosphate export permease